MINSSWPLDKVHTENKLKFQVSYNNPIIEETQTTFGWMEAVWGLETSDPWNKSLHVLNDAPVPSIF